MRTDLPAPWFRLYAEFATDPKVQMLSEIDQRRFLMLCCIRCGNGIVTLLETEIAFQLRISDAEWQTTKNVLYKKGLIDFDNKPVKWNDRQFDSDTSNARVAKHRALYKKKHPKTGNAGVTLLKQKSNAPDTETDTETEVNREDKSSLAPNAKQVCFDAASASFDVPAQIREGWMKAYPAVQIDTELAKAAVWVVANPKNKKSNYARFLANWFTKAQDKAPALGGNGGGKNWSAKPAWVTQAGFIDVADANAARCWQSNASEFHDGKHTEAA